MPAQSKERKFYARIGKNVSSLIKDRKTTPAALARIVGTSKGTMHSVVHGKYCSYLLAAEICKRFGVSLDSLCAGPARKATK